MLKRMVKKLNWHIFTLMLLFFKYFFVFACCCCCFILGLFLCVGGAYETENYLSQMVKS